MRNCVEVGKGLVRIFGCLSLSIPYQPLTNPYPHVVLPALYPNCFIALHRMDPDCVWCRFYLIAVPFLTKDLIIPIILLYS